MLQVANEVQKGELVRMNALLEDYDGWVLQQLEGWRRARQHCSCSCLHCSFCNDKQDCAAVRMCDNCGAL